MAFLDAQRYQECRRIHGSKERTTVNILNPRRIGAFETTALDPDEEFLGEDGRQGKFVDLNEGEACSISTESGSKRYSMATSTSMRQRSNAPTPPWFMCQMYAGLPWCKGSSPTGGAAFVIYLVPYLRSSNQVASRWTAMSTSTTPPFELHPIDYVSARTICTTFDECGLTGNHYLNPTVHNLEQVYDGYQIFC